jgi:hypothetical protein
MSTNKKAKTISSIPSERAPRMSNLNKTGDQRLKLGHWIIPWGIWVTPKGRPTTVDMRIPHRIPPFTPRASRTPVTNSPMAATIGIGLLKFPMPKNVAGSAMENSALLKPIKAMNRPIPAPIAFLRVLGTASIIASLTLVNVSTTNTTPEIKTAPKAVSHGIPIPSTTEYVK